MNFDKIPINQKEEPVLPFDEKYEEERSRIAKEHKVQPGSVDKRADGYWYVNGKRILPEDTFYGLREDDESNPYKKTH
jgi:hypothetical protein